MSNPAHRPTLYEPSYCDLLIEHMSKGFSFESFAGLVKVARSTIYEWVDKNPDFSDAKKVAEEQCRLFWEKTALEGLQVQTGPGAINLNTTMWIFQMKNRFPKEWRDRQQTEISGPDGNPVQTESSFKLTEKNIADLLRIARGEKPDEPIKGSE
jgi:hypothetical protein